MTLDELYAKVLEKSQSQRFANVPRDCQILLDIHGDDPRRWLVAFQGDKASLAEFQGGEPDVTVTCSDKTVLAIADRSLHPTMAYLRGRLKVKGDKALLKLLSEVWPE
jgi:putative sterol carrier protein